MIVLRFVYYKAPIYKYKRYFKTKWISILLNNLLKLILIISSHILIIFFFFKIYHLLKLKVKINQFIT